MNISAKIHLDFSVFLKLKGISVLLVMLTFFNCQVEKEANNSSFKREDAPNVSLKGESIVLNLDSLTRPIFYHLFGDSLILVENIKPNPYFVDVYSMNTKRLVKRIVRQGESPAEFLSVQLFNRNPIDNNFTIFDVSAKSVGFGSMDEKGEFQIKNKVNLPQNTGDIISIDTSKLLGFNASYIETEKFSNKISPLFYLNTDRIISRDQLQKIDSQNFAFFSNNVSAAQLAYSKKNDCIWLVDKHKDEIQVFDTNLKLKKVIKGPDFVEPDIIQNEDKGLGIQKYIDLGFKNHIDYDSYYSCAYNDDHIYLLYLGIVGTYGIKGVGFYYKPSEIFKFNWAGELQKIYKLDRFLYGITIDKAGENIYGTTSIDFGEKVELIKYQLK
ncbi:MAG: BF3164 family lipoprotein [Runella sp.]